MSRQECIHTIKKVYSNSTTFIILCGGKSGVKGVQNIPLTNIDQSTTVIQHQIKTINECYKNADIMLMVGFEAQKITEYILQNKYTNVRIFENTNYQQDSAIDAWRLAINCCTEQDVYLIHGDRLFNNHAISSYNKNKICVSISQSVKKNYNLGITHKNNKLINICYGLPDVWSEILFIPKQYYNIVQSKLNQSKINRIYTVEKFLNDINKQVEIYVCDRNDIEVKTLKEIV